MGSREMKNLVVTRPGPDVVRILAMEQGMRSLMQDAIAKIFMGQTDLDQVRRITVA